MKIEQLRMDNLRDGVFCAKGARFADEWYGNLEAWLDGGLLRGQVARDDNDEAIGFVLYYPIESVPMEVGGDGLYMVQCLQVKPPHDKTGVAKQLIESAVADARGIGASGIVAEGLLERDRENPDHEHISASFLENIGLTKGESRKLSTLYYVVFNPDSEEPSYLPSRFDPQPNRSKLRIDILDCGLCYVGIHNRKTVAEVVEKTKSDAIEVHVHDQSTRQAVTDKGVSTGVFIDGKLTYFRRPISEDEVMDAIDVAESARKHSTER